VIRLSFISYFNNGCWFIRCRRLQRFQVAFRFCRYPIVKVSTIRMPFLFPYFIGAGPNLLHQLFCLHSNVPSLLEKYLTCHLHIHSSDRNMIYIKLPLRRYPTATTSS